MGLKDLFVSKEKKEQKQKEMNNASKMQNISFIQTIKLASKDQKATEILNKIVAELSSQPETGKVEASLIDRDVYNLLNEAHQFILKGQYPIAVTKLNTSLNKAIERHQYCAIGGTLSKDQQKALEKAEKARASLGEVKKTRAEELQSSIDEKTAQKELYLSEYKQLQEQLQGSPNNMAIINRIKEKALQIKTLENSLISYSAELERELKAGMIDVMENEGEDLVGNRTVSDEELDVKMTQVQAQNAARAEQMNKNKELDQFFTTSMMGGATYDPLADLTVGTNQGSVYDPLGVMGNQNQGTAQTQNYGGFDASGVGSNEMANDLRKALGAYEKSIGDYEEKIEDANDDLTDLTNDLKHLLEQRRKASPSECLVLDGKIDSIQSKRSGVISKIKLFRQGLAVLQDKKHLLDQLEGVQDVSAMGARIAQLTGNKFSDFENLSMFLNDYVKKSNQDLQELSVATSVAGSDEVMMNSASAGEANLMDNSITKDDEKYASLEAEVGLVRQAQ